MLRILFTGGGTLGPVVPLLAIAETLSGRADVEIVGLVGTRSGPERELAHQAGLKFFCISAGRWRRYWDIRNFGAWLLTKIGFFESLILLRRLKPTIIVSGGSFVGVSVLWAAWFLRIPTITHQQDVRPSLANRLVSPIVRKITVVFRETARAFPKHKTVVTGNPVRSSILRGDRERGRERFGLAPGVPTLLVFGGGTGALALNKTIVEALPELTKFCQVIHITGIGKGGTNRALGSTDRYHSMEFLARGMADAYAVADLVLARAGMGTMTELASLGKPAIIIPLPGTHQEVNARLLREREAAVVVPQTGLTSVRLTESVRSLLGDAARVRALGEQIRGVNPRDASQQIVRLIEEVGQMK
ncbi:UDP-N-acetylglucosamine--N-acetylmuramyl-(pentapeptide) pyrophosphoryl-undecaprenol N-acetylglucosamine transferase [Candidatus Uhrbacteria bacterium]|nr:UDP-N-acetylglucosamine--N-acetylmuramyl-(pentapeptide) pyrophosphoryl-undecaprenol N-acetylglucosamine transferase [Candidatus Uhrbacteria bacterium]